VTPRRPERCRDCAAFLGDHLSITRRGTTEYGGFQLAPGLIAVKGQKRTFGPMTRSARTATRLLVTVPGPATVACKRCRHDNIVDVGVAEAAL
jgi:hypothetical protein